MNDKKQDQPSGLTSSGVKIFGFLFLAAGIFSKSVLQNGILGLGTSSPQQLLETMQSPNAMLYATIALVLQAAATCAIPIFAFLLIEGFRHTSDFLKYFLRILGLAVISEVPYDFAMSGKWFDFSKQNPVFAMALGLALLYLYRQFQGKDFKNLCLKFLVSFAAIVWCVMLKIDAGGCFVLLLSVLWAFRKNTIYREFAGAAMAAMCSVSSPFFLAAPMGLLVVHFYNEEKGNANPKAQYFVYPVLLLLAGIGTYLIQSNTITML